ncbi:hypothetical protein EVAR_103368_1 [Eumeta japonica]|uniref:Uncharacterized protein n=1 Tax=Eumeta variegata TaxID=151549 RepID=A0A4C1Y9E0_EUMVA|nr:hypothetical protein EVAR_103368_1 [Eumeta japonica]
MGRPTKRTAHRSHPYCKPLRSSIDHHIRLRKFLDHNDVTPVFLTSREAAVRHEAFGGGGRRAALESRATREVDECSIKQCAKCSALFSKKNRSSHAPAGAPPRARARSCSFFGLSSLMYDVQICVPRAVYGNTFLSSKPQKIWVIFENKKEHKSRSTSSRTPTAGHRARVSVNHGRRTRCTAFAIDTLLYY